MEYLATASTIAKWVLILATLWGVFRFLVWLMTGHNGSMSEFWADFFLPSYNWVELLWLPPVILLIFVLAAYSELPPGVQAAILQVGDMF